MLPMAKWPCLAPVQQLKEEIESLGGSVTKSPDSADAFITSKAEYDKRSEKLQGM